MLSIPALLLTAAWVLIVGLILVLFGRTAGGAWSIAGSAGENTWPASALHEIATGPPLAEVDDLGDRPLPRR